MNHKNQMRYVRRFVSRVRNCVVSAVNLCCSTWCNKVNIHLLSIHCLELPLFRMLIHFRLPPSLAFFQASLLRLLVIIWTSGNDRFSVKVWCLSHNDPTPPFSYPPLPPPTHSTLLLTLPEVEPPIWWGSCRSIASFTLLCACTVVWTWHVILYSEHEITL